MAIHKASVDLGAILRFINYLKSPSPTEALNTFGQLIQQQSNQDNMVQPGQAGQVGPTNAAATRAVTPGSRSRALFNTILANPAALAYLPSEALSAMLTSGANLAAMEPKPVGPTEAERKRLELDAQNVPLGTENLLALFGASPTTPPGPLQELDAINQDRIHQGKQPYDVETGLGIVANLHKAAGTSVSVNPVINVDNGVSEFMTKQEVADRNTFLSQIAPTIQQLQKAKLVLETPGLTRWLASNPILRQGGNALATAQAAGFPMAKALGVDPQDFGEAVAALQNGIQSASQMLSTYYGRQRGGDKAAQRFSSSAQTGNWLSNPDQALGAINNILETVNGLQTQTAQEQRQGGVSLNPPPQPGQPGAPAVPEVRAKFNTAVNDKARALLKANPERYPGGAKDPKLVLDAIQAVAKAQPSLLDEVNQLENTVKQELP